jgi:hypothetical protein
MPDNEKVSQKAEITSLVEATDWIYIVRTGTPNLSKRISVPNARGSLIGSGWVEVTDTWVYASATTITVPSGAASIYSVGDKLKLKQTTVKYFYVIDVADTVLTVTAGSDYTVSNDVITSPYYSKASSPTGFPQYFNLSAPTWTTTGTGFTNAPAVSYDRFIINGRQVHLSIRALTNATSGGTGVFIATHAAGQMPPAALTLEVGGAYNLTDTFSGFSMVGSAYSGTVRIAKYDGTAIAGNSKYFYISIDYLI